MSDTPETDKVEPKLGVDRGGWVKADFARQLERELAEVTEQRNELAAACKKLMKVIGSPNDQPEEWWATDDEINDAYEAGEKALKYLTNKQP